MTSRRWFVVLVTAIVMLVVAALSGCGRQASSSTDVDRICRDVEVADALSTDVPPDAHAALEDAVKVCAPR